MAGLYVHVPFRRASRNYDESYYVATEETDFSEYKTALQRELRAYAREYAAEEAMTTVYAGGGRPSLLPLKTVHALLTTVVEVFDASTFEEATAEVNPADATPGYLHGLRHMGFDRLNLSVLSFFPPDLQAFDAPHSAEEGISALRGARAAGFGDLSVDLLFDAEQPLSHWRATLQLAVELRVPHLTLLESPSASAAEADQDALADRLEYAMTFLQSEGYEQYELTHFALPGHRSAHQEHYYAHGNQLGVGPSAESFWWTDRTHHPVGRRWTNVREVKRYVELLEQRYPPVAYRQTLDRRALAREYVLLRLRTDTGLDLVHLRDQYDLDLHAAKGVEIERLTDRGLLAVANNRLHLTNRGRLLADGIAERLLSFD
jgi:oxygen-independent coproporphyrinogen-3 oxidase